MSQPAVVKASRNWVCIRLATYEDEAEARLLNSLYRSRSGQLENTVYVLLAPDGRTPLSYAARGPNAIYRDAGEMAWDLDRLAQYYPGRAGGGPLPLVANYRLALNIAACDNLPLVVVAGSEAERRLAPLAWSDRNLGKAVYVRGPTHPQFGEAYIVRPGQFGLSGTAVAGLSQDLDAVGLATLLQRYRGQPVEFRTHMSEGHRRGVRWETRVPVTDPQGRY